MWKIKIENKNSVLSKKPPIEFCTVFECCLNKIHGKITEREFKKFLKNNVQVDKYISLSTKQSLLDTFHDIGIVDNGLYDLTGLFEIHSILIVLFSYTNINIVDEELTEQNYNVVMESGLVDYIKNQCGEDYRLFLDMVNRTFIFKCYQMSKQFLTLTDIETLEEVVNQTGRMFNEMDNEKLSLIKEVVEFNDPSLQTVKNTLYSIKQEDMRDKEN